MNEIITQIVQKTGIPEDKAQQVLGVVANFIKQKYPQFAGPIDSALGTGDGKDGGDNGGNLLGDLGSKLGF